MIKTATEGAREFGLARVGTVLASSAEAARVTRLIMIAWFSPILIILRKSVISGVTLALTSIVSRRMVGIV